ncbi:hypothetical protein LCGC14_1439470, partial [marine sediment metagenome]
VIPIGASIAMGAMGMGLLTSFPPMSNLLRQSSYRLLPNELVPIGDAVELRYREVISADEYRMELRKQGFNDDRGEWVYKVSENLLNVIELINLHRRGVINQAVLYDEASKVKWSEENVTNLLRVTEAIPSATDIIAFAVREVYSPEIAEAFGQYQGLDEVFEKAKEDIIAVGMTKDTFGKFWAAHWVLPSVGQGFEMVHRRVIPVRGVGTELDLEKLMTALDVMPAWREPLTAISYNPFTRVDVRRMHKIGVITTEAELIDAYMDLGYDEEKAKKMTEFTILYNADPEDAEQTEDDKDKARERDLTKTDVLNGYRDALLEESETKTALAELGYDANEVEYYISRINYNKEKDETDSYLKYYHDAYIRGVMSHNELVDKLNGLNLSGKRVEYLFKVWDLERIARTTKPTKAELMTFTRKKIINMDTFIEEMKGLGYPERYIGWYQRTI